MKRDQMEHILRAAAAITRERDFIVLGSQALLAAVPELPPTLNQSMETRALCISPVDLAISKLIAGRVKDLDLFRMSMVCC